MLEALLMHESTKGTELGSRMNGVALSVVVVLIYEDNNGTTMSLNEPSSGKERKIEDSTIPNTTDVGLVEVWSGDDTDIRTHHATVGTTIHQGTCGRSQVMSGEGIVNISDVDTAVVTAVNLDKTLGYRRNRRQRRDGSSIGQEDLAKKAAAWKRGSRSHGGKSNGRSR
jgi:hypothetical protein